MNRRNWAGIVALAFVIVLGVVAATRPVPYVVFSPGPTVNVLGAYDGKDIIRVSGHREYRDDGALRLTTILPSGPESKVNLMALMSAWVDPTRSVYPYRAIYQPEDTRASVDTQNGIQMTSSQDNAVAAALGALGEPYRSAVRVAEVDKDGPADGKLEVGDLVTAVDGQKVTTIEQLTSKIQPLPVGSQVTLEVIRDGRSRKVRLTTVRSPVDKKSSAVRVQVAPGFVFPFDVTLGLDQNIGGPSGGLMFSMGIYDVLTPGSLTDGKAIAGTGEIDPEGNVGEIGGIQQKLVGAQDDGATLFLVPAGNCTEALGGHYDPDKMRLVKVENLTDALQDVKAWVKNPDAKLTRCTK